MTKRLVALALTLMFVAAGCGSGGERLNSSYVWHDGDAVSFLQIVRSGGQVTGEFYRTTLANGIDPSTEQAAVSGSIAGATLSIRLTGDRDLTVLGAEISGDDLRVTYLDPTSSVVRSYLATPGGQRQYDCAVSALGDSDTPSSTC